METHYTKRLHTLVLLLFFSSSLLAAADIKERFSELFIENRGQVKSETGNTSSDVLFYSQGKQAQLFITNTGYSIVTAKHSDKSTIYNKIDFALQNVSIHREQVKYVKGSYPALHFYHAQEALEDVRTTDMVIVRNIYPGIDWVWSFDESDNPKHEFMVNLGADASVIQYTVSGAAPRLSEGNNILYSSENMVVKEGPIVLQHLDKEYAGAVSVQGNRISFQIPEQLKKAGGFTIDPPLVLLWGAELDTLRTSFKSIAADDSLNTFTVGYSSDYAVPTFPQTNGSYSVYPAKNVDLIIMKTDRKQNLVWATFFGGSDQDQANAVTTSPEGIFVTGFSQSWDFPQATSGNYTVPVQLFGQDAFIAKFSLIGKWSWSTGYGGLQTDEGMDIKYYGGKIYVAGYTASGDFPVLQKTGAYFYQDSSRTRNDAFLLEFDTLGNRSWATNFGGSGHDHFTSLAVDAAGIYLTGYSDSITGSSIPLQNPGGAYYQTTFQQAESFITQFNSAGALRWSTYFGGSGNDYSTGIVKNVCGFLICGTTDGAGIPVLSQLNDNYYQPAFAGGTDGFIAKFDNTTLQQEYGTYYGNYGNDVLTKIASDVNCNTVTTGYTNVNITTVGNPIYYFVQDTIKGLYDALMLGLNDDQSLIWATTFGSTGNDFGYSVWFPHIFSVDIVGEGFYNYGKLRIGGTYLNDSCNNPQFCPQVTSNGVSNRFLQVDSAAGGGFCPGGGPPVSICASNLQFQALIPMKNTCANQCNGEARIDTANIGGCPPYQLLWNNGNLGLQDSNLCELYWSKVIDFYGQERTLYGRFDIFRVSRAEAGVSYCSTAIPYWDSLIQMTGGGPPYTIQYRGVFTDSCPNVAYFDLRDTAGCIISYSLPWYRFNLGLTLDLEIDAASCMLKVEEDIPYGTCVTNLNSYTMVLFDGTDTIRVPYSELSGVNGWSVTTQPGRFYSGYLELPDCEIPVNGVYSLDEIRDTITKVLSCQAADGSISVTIFPDSGAVANNLDYPVFIHLEGDSTGTIRDGLVSISNYTPQTLTFSNLLADNYKISYYSIYCDTFHRSADLKTVDFEFNAPNTYCGRSDTLIADVTGGFTPFTFNWSPPAANSASITVYTPGVYALTVTDNNGCSSSLSINVPGSAELQITGVSENLTPCISGLFSSASVSSVGGTQPYLFVWSSGESSNFANFLPQGNNWIQVYDFNGCTDADSFQNTKQLPVTATTTVTDVSCFGYNNGSIALSILYGYPVYSVAWSDGSSGSINSGLAQGVYEYTITDARGCDFRDMATVIQPDSISYFTFTVDATCWAFDGYADITVNGGSGNITILWDDGDQNFTRADLQSGNHTFVLIDNNGCSQAGYVDIGQDYPPLDYTATVTPLTCFGSSDGTIDLFVNDPYTPISYLWDNGAITSFVTGLSGGYHDVEITDSIGCVYNEQFWITEPDSLFIFNIQTNPASCSAANGYAYLNISGGELPHQINWSDGGTGFSRNNLMAASYIFTVTDANNCELVGSVTITENNPIFIDLDVSNISCHGDSNGAAVATVFNALTPITHEWSTGSQLSFVSDLQAGTYFLTVTDNRGCVSIEQFQIFEPTVFRANVDTGNGILCNGGEVQVFILGSGGTFPYNGNSLYLSAGTYTETITDFNGCPASVTFTLSEPGPISASVSIVQPTCTTPGTVSVSASGGLAPYNVWYASVNYGTFNDTISFPAVLGFNIIQIFDTWGCETDLSTVVNTIGAPVGTANTSDPLCIWTNTGSVRIVMTQGANPFSIRGTPFTDSVTMQNLSAGIYSDTVTDANGCFTVFDYILSDPDSLISSYDIIQHFVCSDDSLFVSFYANGGTPPYSGTGTFRFASGSFVHTIVDVNGCSSDIAFSLTAPPVFAVDTSFVYPDCNNNFGYLHLDASGGIGPYSIQNGQTTISFADTITFTLIPGSYSYTISDSLGCLENIAFSIDPVNAVLGYIQANNTNCNGDSSGSLKIVMTRGAAPYIINGISFLDSTILINLPAGSYQFDVTDANNCSIALNAIILQPGTLLVDSIVIASNITCEGLNDAVIQVIASGGTPAYTYVLISPTGDTVSQNGNVFGALGTGTYTAIVIDSFGCVSLSSIFIPPFFDATQRIEQDSVSCYGKQDGAIKIYSEPTERNPYMYSLNGGSPQVYNVFYNLGAGDYWIVVYDKNNCTDTLNVTMAQPDSIDSKVWLNGELLPVDSLDLDERMYADFTKQNFHPWEISFSPDVTRIDESLSLIRIQPRESITFTVMIYMDSFDTNCFVEYNGLIDLRNVAPVPNIITPNNDGFNDLWEIDLDKFPSPEVTIFNRWGEIIFRSENYTNNWNGLYRDKHVADGTYFYLLKVPSHNNKVYKGNINVLNSAR